MKKSLLLLGLLASLNVNAELIQDGSFELYSVTNGAAHVNTSGTGCASGVNCIAQITNPAWAKTDTAPDEFLEVRDNFFGTAQNGSNFVELNPALPSGFQQTFNAISGTGTLTWWDKGRSAEGSNTTGVGNYNYSVFLNGNIFTGNTIGTDNWRQQSFNVTLNDGLNTLRFVSNSPADLGAQIDNISLVQNPIATAVPEPETYGMMMLGLAMLGFASRRRKQ